MNTPLNFVFLREDGDAEMRNIWEGILEESWKDRAFVELGNLFEYGYTYQHTLA
jgi:hypothetical protein